MRRWVGTLMLAGCAAANPPVSPDRVGYAESLPDGYEEVGHVVASCRLLGGFGPSHCEPLASFDCDRSRLTRILAERAARRSGDLLVGLTCGRDGSVLRCRATAARSEDARARAASLPAAEYFPVPGPRVVARWDEPRAEASLAIEVDFEPSVRRFDRARLSYADVAEVAALPVSHRELGLLTTRCDEDECTLRELRHALRVAAGGLGASDLVGVRCFGRDGSHECIANLAAAEVAE